MATTILTQERLTTLLSYDAKTGVFVWRKTGKIAGTRRFDGYIKICVDKRQLYAHRLAWFYMYGEHPDCLDHIDRNPSNNQIANLRAVTRSENQQNRVLSRNNTSGYKGVTFCKHHSHWIAVIWHKNRAIWLGNFKQISDAVAAYAAAQLRLHPNRPTT